MHLPHDHLRTNDDVSLTVILARAPGPSGRIAALLGDAMKVLVLIGILGSTGNKRGDRRVAYEAWCKKLT
jgi:hypothetical protein